MMVVGSRRDGAGKRRYAKDGVKGKMIKKGVKKTMRRRGLKVSRKWERGEGRGEWVKKVGVCGRKR